MNGLSELHSKIVHLGIGIVADADSAPLLPQTIKSAAELTNLVYVLAVGDFKIQLPNNETVVIRCDVSDDEAAHRNALIAAVEDGGEAEFLLWMNPGDIFDTLTIEDFRLFVENEIQRDTLYLMVLHRYVNAAQGHRDDNDEETIDARLMPLNKGVRFSGAVQPSLLERSSALMFGISAAPGRFIVPPKRNDPRYTKKRAEKVLRILDALESAGTDIAGELLFEQANALLTLENYAAARRIFYQFIKTAEQADFQRMDLKLSAYYGIWQTLIKSPISDTEVTKFLVAALEVFPNDMQLLSYLGSHMQRIGKPELAVRTFKTAVDFGRVSLDVWHRLRMREITVTSLALALRLQGKNDEAIAVMEQNLPLIEDTSVYSRYLLDIYIQESEEDKAGILAATLWGDVLLDQMRAVIHGACLAKRGEWKEALSALEEAYNGNCRDVLALRWYALSLMAAKEFAKAGAVLDEWLKVDPSNAEAKNYKNAASTPDKFTEKLMMSRDKMLKHFGVPADNLIPRRNPIRIDDAVREMIAAGADSGQGQACEGELVLDRN